MVKHSKVCQKLKIWSKLKFLEKYWKFGQNWKFGKVLKIRSKNLAKNWKFVFYLNSKSFDIISSVRASCKVRQIELNLIPSIVKSHWHCANKRLDPCSTLIVWCAKSTSNIFIIQYLNKIGIKWFLTKFTIFCQKF